jgi:hypothetical protein
MRRIKVTSSSIDITRDQVKTQSRQSAKLFLKPSELGLIPSPAGECSPHPFGSGGEGTFACGRGGGGVPIPIYPYLQTAGQIVKDDVNGFPSFMDICFNARNPTECEIF